MVHVSPGRGTIIPEYVHQCCLTVRFYTYCMSELAKLDSRLSVYFTALAFLHGAYKPSRHGLNNELMDVLATLLGHFIYRRLYSNNNFTSTLSHFYKAAKLLQVVANKSLSTTSLIEIELSKAYLNRTLRYSDSNSIYWLANIYLAVLYYTTGQYQTAIDHCTLVTRSQDHSQCSSHVVQGELLHKIDDDIDNVLGLAVFYQHVRSAALNQQYQPQHVSVFTTELFAYCLHVKLCRRFTQTSSDEFKRYKICTSDTEQLFICDVLLFVSLSRLLKQKKIQQTS